MSDSSNPVITETVHAAQPAVNPYDGNQEAYAQHDQAQSLEQALDEKKEVDAIKGKIQELEGDEDLEQVEAAPKQEDEFSSKFAALSRREKQLREKEAHMQGQYEKKLAELEARIEAMQKPQVEEVAKPKELPLEYRLKKDPLGTLKELGLSFDQLTNLALNDGKLTPEMQMDLMRQEIDQKYSSELESLRNDLLERDRKQEEAKYNETVQNFQAELANFVNDNDQYELIRANDATEVVFDVIEQHYNDTGRILSKQEAADQVEAYLEEEVEKLLKLNKLKNKLAPQDAVRKVESPEPTQIQKAPTLSNAHSAAASNIRRPTSREDSVSIAASLLKWNE